MSLWKQIGSAQTRIRDRVLQVGTAARWHMGKAREVLKSKSRIGHLVPFTDEDEQAAHLKALPRLIGQVKEQDAVCAALWTGSADARTRGRYQSEAKQLVKLLGQFRLRLLLYERLVRQPEKPNLQQARGLIADGGEDSAEARGLVTVLRLPLAEYVSLEETHETDLRRISEWREEVVQTHAAFAERRAEALASADTEAVGYAMCGLRKAVEYFSPGRGFRFRPYAEEWIRTAVQNKKRWGL